jgi:uncharacterized protein (DUF1778 family)
MYGNLPYICSMAARQSKNRRSRKPRLGQQRSARLEARVTKDQKTLIERAAAYQGRSVSDFVVGALADAAKTVVEEHELIRLNPAESRRFVELLLNPPEPNAALKAAARKWRRTVTSR